MSDHVTWCQMSVTERSLKQPARQREYCWILHGVRYIKHKHSSFIESKDAFMPNLCSSNELWCVRLFGSVCLMRKGLNLAMGLECRPSNRLQDCVMVDLSFNMSLKSKIYMNHVLIIETVKIVEFSQQIYRTTAPVWRAWDPSSLSGNTDEQHLETLAKSQ